MQWVGVHLATGGLSKDLPLRGGVHLFRAAPGARDFRDLWVPPEWDIDKHLLRWSTFF